MRTSLLLVVASIASVAVSARATEEAIEERPNSNLTFGDTTAEIAKPDAPASQIVTATMRQDGVLRSSPEEDAALTGAIRAGAPVRVGLESTHGYRRVVLLDGSAGYVQESLLNMPQSLDGDTSRRSLVASYPITYMRDLDHLESFTREDPGVQKRISAIRSRKQASAMFAVLSIASSLTGLLVGLNSEDCYQVGYSEVCQANGRPMLIGAGIGAGFVILGLATHPRRPEIVDALNQWNHSHPERPIGLD